MHNTVSSFIACLPTRSKRPSLILGLSGGPDSVYLFHALHSLHESQTITLHAVHINHGWRDSAKYDQAFCEQLCARFNISLNIEHAADWSNKVPSHKIKNASPESHAREIRRTIFAYYHKKLSADFVALAHHQDDQIETFFIRLIRGASTSGLTGMSPVSGFYIRPLLFLNKEEILMSLEKENHSFCIDSTNSSDAHLRNRIRAQLIPALTACDERARTNIVRTMNKLKYDADLLHAMAYDIHTKLVDEHGTLCRKTFCQLAAPLQTRILEHMLINAQIHTNLSEGLLNEISRFLSSSAGGTHIINNITVVKKERRFSILLSS